MGHFLLSRFTALFFASKIKVVISKFSLIDMNKVRIVRGEEFERILGFNHGADDYLVKPFSLAELSARVNVQKRHLERTYEKEEREMKDVNL